MVMGVAICTLAGSAMAGSQFYRLGVGNGLSWDISEDGVVVGETNPRDPYFKWSADSGYMLIGGASGGDGVGGTPSISSDGSLVGGTWFNPGAGHYEMARYSVGTNTWTGLGGIPGNGQNVDGSISSGYGISGDGTSVVGLGWTTVGFGDAHAFQWTEGVGAFDLGSNAVGQSSRANAVNFDGSVTVGWQDGNGRQGSVWVNGVQELINPADPFAAGEAFAVSADGQWVTGFHTAGFFGSGNAWRYNTTTDTFENLGNLAVGAQGTMAGAAITDDGKTIVGGTWGFGPASWGNAFIWREGIGTMALSDYLDSMNIAYDPDFRFAYVSGISGDGQWLTGWGDVNGNLQAETWVIRIPAPGTGVLLAAAGLMGIRRRR